MNLDEQLFYILDCCNPSQALSFYYVVDGNAVGFSVAFYNYANKRITVDGTLDCHDGVLYPRFASTVKKIDVRRDDAPALLSRAVDSFISACDAASLAKEHNRKAQQ